MKRTLSILAVTIMLLCMVTPTVFAAKENFTTINVVTVEDILEPLDGYKLDFSATPGHATKYSITKINWSEYDPDWEWERDPEANDTCVKGNYYVVFVTLEAKGSYVFADSNLTAQINGCSANKYPVQNDGKTVQIYYAFDPCKKNIARVDLTIVNPVVGKTPTFGKVNTDEYESKNTSGVSNQTNGVTWTNQSSGINLTVSNPFKENTKYTVMYYLTAKENCWFNGTKYYINGQQVELISSNAGKTEVVVGLTDLLATDKKTAVSRIDLTVVKPVVGKTPTFAKVDTTQYVSEKYGTISNCTNGVTWTNQSSGINLTVSNPFKEGVKYKVTYYFTAKDGYKFDSTTKATINGITATVTLTDATHVAVSLSDIIPGDGKKEIATLDLSVTAPKDGEKPTYTKIDGTGYYSDNGLNGTSTKIYKNGIAWYKSASSYIAPGTTETFKGGTGYTVKIALTPKDGYKFSASVTAKINGKAATVETFDDGSVTVSAVLTAAEKDHTHTPSAWRTTGAYHYKACTACGEMLEQEDHKGGVATCSTKGKCTVCGYAYVEENEDHNPDTSKWTACGNLYHAHLCKDCGAHAVIEDHKAGPAATETEPQKCTVCGYIIAPAKNHTHKLTKVERVEPTCIEAGNVEYYTCDGCSDLFADSKGKTKLTETVIAPLGHVVSDDWSYDETNHWRTCSVCNEVLIETEMAHELTDGQCATCGYDESIGVPTVPAEPDDSQTTDTKPKDNGDGDKGNGMLLWIIIGAVVLIAAGVVIVIVMKKKKK